MDEPAVRERAQAFCDALVAGDVDRAIESLSNELHRRIGEVLVLFPLPAKEAGIDSVEHGASAYVVVLRLVGETEEVLVQTRWKERDGTPTIIEASHLSSSVLAASAGEAELEAEAGEPG